MKVAPTKSNQLRLRRDLDMASEGFALLDQKREILVMELMRLLEKVRRTHKRLREAQAKAYGTLKKAVASNGFHRMQSVAGGVSYEHQVSAQRTRIIAGVRVPQLSCRRSEFSSQFGFSGTDSLVDATMKEFLELLEVVGEMAALETAAWLLARELKKTQRRVNALEQIFIPDFRDNLKFISESLESKELQSFFVMKQVKQRARERSSDGNKA